MLQNNYLIINKKAGKFDSLRLAGKTAVFLDGEGKPVDFGVLPLGDSVYAVMGCEQISLLMMVTDRQGVHNVVGIFWKDGADYAEWSRKLADAAGVKLYRQDLRISSYAWSIAAKLDEGVRIRVADAADASDMLVCSECGMHNPKGSQYCLECGADL